MDIANMNEVDLERYVTRIMLDMGIPAHLKGYHYLREAIILSGKDIASSEDLKKHADWVHAFLPGYDSVTEKNIDGILKQEIGRVFVKVLEDAGVYKCTEEGRAAFLRFLNTL